MDILQLFVLSVVQGFTEFLPISSSAHLILVPKFLGWEDQGLAFDVAAHVGTLFAVLFYFKRELVEIFRDFFLSIKKREQVGESSLAWAVGFGTLTVGICGLMLGDFVEEYLRSPLVIAFATIAFGLLLWQSDMKNGDKQIKSIGIKEGLLIGAAQALALIPGTSRSGITITAALFMGYDRVSAAKFSFLLSIPVIVLAGGLKITELATSNSCVDWLSLFITIALSAISAYICIFFFLKIIEKSTMLPFVIYRLVLGLFLFIVFM